MFHDQNTIPTPRNKAVMVGAYEAKLNVSRSVSSGAAKLIWHEFFESRQRGIDWAAHLPWTRQKNMLCVSAKIETNVVGALLIKYLPMTDAAMVGYICVHSKHRGQKLSWMLIDFAANALASSELNRLVLWTERPQLYENSGFVTTAREQCLKLKLPKAISNSTIKLTRWPLNKTSAIGLPPFANAGWLAESANASIIFVDTPKGSTLLDFRGVPASVVDIMALARSDVWMVTLDAHNKFVVYATKHNLIVDQATGPVTMVRQLTETSSVSVRIPLIERI